MIFTEAVQRAYYSNENRKNCKYTLKILRYSFTHRIGLVSGLPPTASVYTDRHAVWVVGLKRH